MTLLAVAGCFMVLLGLLAIVGVVGPIARRVRRFRGRAIGKIVAIETSGPGSAVTSYRRAADIPVGPGMARSYRLVVEFLAASTPYKAYSLWKMRPVGKRITMSRIGARKDQETTIGGVPFDAGQTVDVIYDPADPAMAVADDGGAYAQFALQVFIGFLLAIVGSLMLFAAGRLAWLGPGWRP
jgi:hypothetical protein